jgi:DNA-binding transcriptional ArsR family regulator
MLNTQEIKRAAMVIRAINHPVRLKILQVLREMEDRTVTELGVDMRLLQPIISQQLAILRRADLVLCQKDGKFTKYSVNEDRVEQIGRLAGELVNYRLPTINTPRGPLYRTHA